MTTKCINIGQEFSLDPAGRYRTDGGGSGEEFREDVLKGLVLSLKPNEKLTVILDDGVEAYGSSFLVEAFAGLVKYGLIGSKELQEKLVIQYEDPDFEYYKDKIFQYISEASFDSEKYTPT